MDIVNRLKTYMDSENIGSTQFADACRIPRPTLSQILSGRNKKISDEVIAKIHDAYPNLSVMWLLFGEGDMLASPNIKVSELQKGGFIDFSTPQNVGMEEIAIGERGAENASVFGSENQMEPSLFGYDELGDEMGCSAGANQSVGASSPSAAGTDGTKPNAISIDTDAGKSIVSIMVFYSDNSFQSFVPSSSRK